MTDFEIIAHVPEPSKARILVIALKAHGFNPMEGDAEGLPGMPGITGPRGVAIRVPEDEAADAKLLVEDLLKDMRNS